MPRGKKFTAERIIKKAGVKQWPKLFVNCRASCEKDLMEIHRPDAVLAWIGHSARVAIEHYAPGPTESDLPKSGAESGAVIRRLSPSGTVNTSRSPWKIARRREGRGNSVPPTGIEPVT